jgi:hypothetical protein
MVRRKPIHGSRDGFGGPSKVRLGISITAPVLAAGLPKSLPLWINITSPRAQNWPGGAWPGRAQRLSRRLAVERAPAGYVERDKGRLGRLSNPTGRKASEA